MVGQECVERAASKERASGTRDAYSDESSEWRFNRTYRGDCVSSGSECGIAIETQKSLSSADSRTSW